MALGDAEHLIHQTLLRESLLKGNKILLQASGGSMWPFIRSGDRLHVIAADRFLVGDILLYERGDVWYVHRLVRQIWDAGGERRLILRGDANPADDPPAVEGAVLGRVVKMVRGSSTFVLDGRRARAYSYTMRRPFLRDLIYVTLFKSARQVKRRFYWPGSR